MQTSRERIFLNTDGAVQLVSRYATSGGVVRGKHGDWIVGYHWYLGKCSIFDVNYGYF